MISIAIIMITNIQNFKAGIARSYRIFKSTKSMEMENLKELFEHSGVGSTTWMC